MPKLTLEQDVGLYSLWIHSKCGTLTAAAAKLIADRLDRAGVPFDHQNIIAAAGERQQGFRETLSQLGLRTY